jgi:hypothetical protein
MKSFTQDDVRDKALLESLITEETNRIFESDKARKGRTRDQVYAMVKQGKIAEVYLKETGRFEFADIKWHDLVNSYGEYCEVKAYDVNDWMAPSVIRDITRYKTESWCKSTWYYLFQYRSGTYKLLAVLRIK